MLLGLRIIRGGQETVRYLEVEQSDWRADAAHITLTMTPRRDGDEEIVFQSPVLKTHLRLYDESGEKIVELDGGVPLILLSVGLYDAVRRELDFPDTPDESRKEFAGAGLGWAALFTFLRLAVGKSRLSGSARRGGGPRAGVSAAVQPVRRNRYRRARLRRDRPVVPRGRDARLSGGTQSHQTLKYFASG